MEQDINDLRKENHEDNNFFKVEYKNQDVSKLPEFIKWYENTYQYVNNENIQISKEHNNNYYHNLLTIGFCDNCLSYVMCWARSEFCYVKCNECNTRFCIGCSRKQEIFDDDSSDHTICIKGYFKLFYLRAIYRRSELIRTIPLFYILHIIFCLFLTPLYIGFISNAMGLIIHPRKKRNGDKLYRHYYLIINYSILRGICMLPYITLFLPFMIILLIPAIFSYKYYLYVFITYITAIWPGSGCLENVGDN